MRIPLSIREAVSIRGPGTRWRCTAQARILARGSSPRTGKERSSRLRGHFVCACMPIQVQRQTPTATLAVIGWGGVLSRGPAWKNLIGWLEMMRAPRMRYRTVRRQGCWPWRWRTLSRTAGRVSSAGPAVVLLPPRFAWLAIAAIAAIGQRPSASMPWMFSVCGPAWDPPSNSICPLPSASISTNMVSN